MLEREKPIRTRRLPEFIRKTKIWAKDVPPPIDYLRTKSLKFRTIGIATDVYYDEMAKSRTTSIDSGFKAYVFLRARELLEEENKMIYGKLKPHQANMLYYVPSLLMNLRPYYTYSGLGIRLHLRLFKRPNSVDILGLSSLGILRLLNKRSLLAVVRSFVFGSLLQRSPVRMQSQNVRTNYIKQQLSRNWLSTFFFNVRLRRLYRKKHKKLLLNDVTHGKRKKRLLMLRKMSLRLSKIFSLPRSKFRKRKIKKFIRLRNRTTRGKGLFWLHKKRWRRLKKRWLKGRKRAIKNKKRRKNAIKLRLKKNKLIKEPLAKGSIKNRIIRKRFKMSKQKNIIRKIRGFSEKNWSKKEIMLTSFLQKRRRKLDEVRKARLLLLNFRHQRRNIRSQKRLRIVLRKARKFNKRRICFKKYFKKRRQQLFIFAKKGRKVFRRFKRAYYKKNIGYFVRMIYKNTEIVPYKKNIKESLREKGKAIIYKSYERKSNIEKFWNYINTVSY